MAKKDFFTTEQVIEALHQGRGYVSKAAETLGCSVRTVYNYAENHKTVRQAWQDIREKRHDYVENKMMTKIDEGDTTMIIFYAKTQMKERGYIERQEVTGKDGAAQEVVLRVVYGSRTDDHVTPSA
jgi:hypothetical protein